MDAGFLLTTVLDVVHNGKDIAILDSSISCHALDVLKNYYQLPVIYPQAGEKGYSYLLLNAVTAQMGAFYDANKNCIGSIEDKNYTEGSVIFEDHQYSIPSNAAYIRLNMPKYCDWSAILSVKSIL